MSDGRYANEHRNTFSVVRLTLFRLHTRPRRPYKARLALQLFCVGVTNNLHAVFSQCPRTLPVVVSCTWCITLMFHPSCNNSDLLHSGMRFIFTFQSSLSWQLCRVCTPPLRSPAGYLFAGTCRLNAAFRTTLLERYTAKSCAMSCLTSARCFLVYTFRAACSLSLLATPYALIRLTGHLRCTHFWVHLHYSHLDDSCQQFFKKYFSRVF